MTVLGLNETSGKLIFSPISGFVGDGNGKSEIVLANAWAVGVSQQAKAPDSMEVGRARREGGIEERS